jgi:hypothetical protein
MTPELALRINYFIDRYHSQEYWSYPFLLAVFFMLEIFLPPRASYESRFDKYFTWFKFGLVAFAALIAASQGFAGGCLVQLPQNWLAQNYLSMPYWHEYGLAFREYVPAGWHWLLRLVYMAGGCLCLWAAYRYYLRRVKINP